LFITTFIKYTVTENWEQEEGGDARNMQIAWLSSFPRNPDIIIAISPANVDLVVRKAPTYLFLFYLTML
jgi:hypothetical protein